MLETGVEALGMDFKAFQSIEDRSSLEIKPRHYSTSDAQSTICISSFFN
jgi:hypothetical protein